MLLSLLLTQGNLEAPPSVLGNLAATESGQDTLASIGKVLVEGVLSVTETAGSTFTGTGNVFVKGLLSVSETGSDTFAATGSAKKTSTGSLSVTETGADTLSSLGRVIVKATTVAIIETSTDALAAIGKVLVKSASVTLTEGSTDTKTATGQVLIKGPFSSSEFGTDGFTASGFLTTSISGTLSATESGGGVPFGGVSAVMKYWNGSSWQVLYKDPTIYT